MKYLWAVTLAALAAGMASADYNATLVDGTLSQNQNVTINLKAERATKTINGLTVQAVYSSATFAAATFTDGKVSSGSITILNNAALSAQAATNQVTIGATATILAASATNYMVVLTTQSLVGKTITYNGNPLIGGTQWAVVDTTTGTAQNIANAINKFNGVHATRTNSQVDLTALPAGSPGNGKTLSVNTSSITVGGANFGAGHNNRIMNAVVTVNGRQYPAGRGWHPVATSTGTAVQIASLLNHIAGIKANAVASVVYATATVAGADGNSFTLASSQPSYMTVGAASFSGGRSTATLTVNGLAITFTVGASSAATATSIASGIVAKTALGLAASAIVNVVGSTSTATGSSKNYTIATNAPGAFTLNQIGGGLDSAFSTNGSVVHLPSHGFSSGLPVTFSTSTGVGLAPLVPGTSYYVSRIGTNDIALSTTSAQALAGSYIALGTQSTAGPHSYVLTPVALAGTASIAWQGSNDCSNYTALQTVSPFTFSSPYTAGSTSWDFGTPVWSCLRAVLVTPSGAGGWNLKMTATGY